MKPSMLAGSALTALGIILLVFHSGVRYTAREKYPRDGEAQIVTHQQKVFSVPVALAGAVLVTGIGLMIVAARR